MTSQNTAPAAGIRQHPRHPGTALVIGGGYAGLVTARVLADHFTSVVVLEQDPLDADTGAHPHAPQGYHAHAVLAKGAEVLERLFPGLRAEFSEAGAPIFDYGEQVSFLLPPGFAPRAETGVRIQALTRDELERRLRRRVLALPGVSLRPGTRCVGLSVRDGRVTGVSVLPAAANADGDGDGPDGPGPAAVPGAAPEEIPADLVVAASGRAGALTGWLDRLGIHVPPKRVVKGKITYTSVCFDRPATPTRPDYQLASQITFAPDVPRGGVLLAVEGERWICSLFGVDEDMPPTDDDGYLEFARSLDNPRLAEQLGLRDDAAPVYRYTNMNNEWNLYHRVAHWPERLLAVGDAVCVFNPVYGQGLTVAALEADLLRGMLERRRDRAQDSRKPGSKPGPDRPDGPDHLAGLAADFQRRTARLILPSWTLSSNSDLMWSPGRPPAAARFAHWYNKNLFAVAVERPAVWAAFARVVNMLAPPTTLFRPSIAARVLGHALRARAGVRPRRGE